MERELTSWFLKNQRDLPWRKSTPWGVMISEFMLQQTPVIRVLPKWQEWIDRWPTPGDLAVTEKSEVIRAWGRLGYPRRALRLWESSGIIFREHKNTVPSEVDQLLALPGVGRYTARAISSFAFNQSHNVLDINIRRVYARVLDGVDKPSKSLKRVEEDRPIFGATWSAGVMELGALICTARNPRCEICPLSRYCSWRMEGYPEDLSEPVIKKNTWQGSMRQCRGEILQQLRDCLDLEGVKNFKWSDQSQLERALLELEKEGFISLVKGRYRLA